MNKIWKEKLSGAGLKVLALVGLDFIGQPIYIQQMEILDVKPKGMGFMNRFILLPRYDLELGVDGKKWKVSILDGTGRKPRVGEMIQVKYSVSRSDPSLLKFESGQHL